VFLCTILHTCKCTYYLCRQMKLLLRYYGIETTEIPEEPMAHGGPPPPPTHRRASEGLGVGPSMEAPPSSSVSSPRHSWPSTGGGAEPGVNRGQVGGVFRLIGSSQGMGFAAALNPLQVRMYISFCRHLSLRRILRTYLGAIK
jgi:hypothetical protein